MKVLFSRITEAINAKPKIESLCDDLTLIGIEVDEIKSFEGDKIIDFDIGINEKYPILFVFIEFSKTYV